MTETLDQLIQARFDAVASPLADADWSDVLGRLGRPQRTSHPRRMSRRFGLVAAVAVVAAVSAAVAFGWPRTVIDFFTSPPAPAHIKNWFGAENVGAPPGMSPQAIPREARKIATATFDANHIHQVHPTVHTLYVAPRRGGGFCYLWTNANAGCFPARSSKPLGLSSYSNDYAVLVDGWIRTGPTRTLEARFADGTTAAIPVTRVSAPVNAGFFVYPIPASHLNRTDALASVVALDASGNVVARQGFRLTKPLDQDIPQTLPDGTKVFLQRRAQAGRARKIVSFRATDGHHIYLWVMPRTGGGTCFVYNQGSGCSDPRFDSELPVLNGGAQGGGGTHVLFFEEVKPNVSRVDLRYQDGGNEQLRPADGFILTEISPAHWRLGTRLFAAVALNRNGKTIYTQRFRPRGRGLYPCRKRVDLGYGLRTCP